jgi:hypothetical protein
VANKKFYFLNSAVLKKSLGMLIPLAHMNGQTTGHWTELVGCSIGNSLERGEFFFICKAQSRRLDPVSG